MEYLQGSAKGAKVRKYIENEGNEIFTHCVSVAEIVSKVERNGNDSEVAWKAITSNSRILEVDEADAKAAGLCHSEVKLETPNFSLGDAFVLSAARMVHAKVLTGDPDFESVVEAIML
jgi:predicted nucleic acid-binding protein